MAVKKKSELSGVEKLREKIKKQEQEKRTANKSESNASNKTSLSGVEKLREKVRKENPSYRSSAPFFGGTTLPTKTEESTKTSASYNPATVTSDNKRVDEIKTELNKLDMQIASYAPATTYGNKNNGKVAELSSRRAELYKELEKLQTSPEKAELLKKREELEKSKAGFGDIARRLVAGPFASDDTIYNFDMAMSGGYNADIDKQIAEIDKQIAQLDGVSYEKNPTFKDLTVNSFMRGLYNSKHGIESYKKMSGQSNNSDYYKNKLDDEKYAFEADDWYEQLLSGPSEILGQWFTMYTDPLAISSATAAGSAAAIAGQVGPQVALPEEAITVPGAFLAGLKAGGASVGFEIEAGGAYNEMIELGISHDTASKLALGVGIVNASLEMMQIDDLVKSFKVLNKTKATKGTAAKIAKYLAERGINVLTETTQEVAQEGATIAGANIGSKIDKGEWAYNGQEVGGRLLDTAKSSALTFAGLGFGGDAVNYGANRVFNNKPQSNDTNTLDEEQQTADKPIADQTTAEPDTLEKAAMDVVANRNAQESGNVAKSAVSDEGSMIISPEDQRWYTTTREAAQAVANDIESGMSAEELQHKSFEALTARESVLNRADGGRTLTEAEKQQAEMLYKKYFYYDMAAKNPQEALSITKSVIAKAEQISESGANSSVVGESGTIPTPETKTANSPSELTRNKPMTVEEAQKVSGYGENGAKLFAEAVNNANGENIIDIKLDMNVAYMAGFTNQYIDLDSDLKREAFYAGKKDRTMQDLTAKENAKSATVYGKNSGVIKNEYYEQLSPAEQEMFSIFAEDFGESAEMVNEIVAATIKGKKYMASGSHNDGRITGSATTKKPVHQWIMHENGHRMEQMATDEWNILSDALYARAERLGRRAELGVSQGMAFDRTKTKYENAGKSKSTRGYVGEVVMLELETIFSSAEEFNAWRAELDAKPQVKTAWAKFMEWLSEIFERVKWTIANRKLSPEARAAAKAEITEMEHIMQLYTNAYKATRSAVAERTAVMESANVEGVNSDTSSRNNIDNSAEMEYTGNENTAREEAVTLEDNKVKGENINDREEEISDTRNAESRGRVGEEVSGRKGSNREQIKRKIQEILRKSSVKKSDTGVDVDRRRTARIEHKETAEAFEDRVLSDGYMYANLGATSVGYKYATKSEWSKEAKVAAETLESLGITVVVFERDLHVNSKGVSEICTEGVTVGLGDNVTVFISSNLDLDGLETAYHEAFHALKRINGIKYNKRHHEMIDIISAGVNVESEAFEKFVSYISELYSYEVKETTSERFSAEIIEEFYAWYIGVVNAKNNGHDEDVFLYIKRFSNPDNIKEQLNAVFEELKSKTDTAKTESSNAPKTEKSKAKPTTKAASEAKTEVNVPETKTLTLKHTKNIFSLFKGEARVVVGKDVIMSGNVAMPLTDNALAEVKKVVDENKIEMGSTASFDKLVTANNDVILSGNPKVAETVIKGKKANVYVFKVGSDYYVCEQKYLDAFNNGENIIKANKDKRKLWTVHDKNDNVVGVFFPVNNSSITDAEYDSLQSVNDVLEANKARKATQKNAPFNATETNLLCSQPKLMAFGMNDNTFITDGKLVIKADNSAIDYIKSEYKSKSNGELVSVDNLGERIEGFIKNDVVGEVSQTMSDDITETDKNGRTKVKHRRTACIIGDMAFLFDTKYYGMLTKRSSTIKILSGGDLRSTVAVGYDSDGNFVGFIMPIRPADGNYIEVNGKQIPYTLEINKKSSPKATPKKTTTAKETPKKTKTKVVETTTKLDDFGEKIGGARKDQWSSRGLLVDDLDGMNDRERDKNVKKDNVWKRPNYRALVESGEDRGLLWAVNEIRKSLQQNVYYGYKATDETKMEKQKLFIETIRAIQAMAESAKTKADFEAMGEKWLIDNGYLEDTGRTYTRYAYTHKFSQNPALVGSTYLNTIRYLAKNFDNLTTLADRNLFAVDTKSVVPKGFSIIGGEGSTGSKLVNGEWVKDTSYSVAKGRYIIQSGFATREEALEWLKQGIAKKKGKTRFVPKQLLEVHRKGPDYRNGKSVDGQNYIDTFGFKGGEFGNWMSAKDRQVSLDYGYDALKDLADALSIEDTDISFGGNLNIAFGARGQGLSGAAAHYENERRVINLTKMNGAGSLAHEWFHSLDDFIGGYKSEYATNTPRNLPERSQKAIRDLITAMRYKDATQEETDLARQHAYDRAIKSVTYQVKNQFGWVEKFENGTLLESDTKYFKRTPTQADVDKYHTLLTSLLETGDAKYIDELSNLRKEVRGNVISKEDRTNLAFRLYALKPSEKEGVQLSRKATDFFNNSVRFGQIHSKDGDYWDSTVEMAARAFACYVADKTNKQNDYLSAHSDSAITLDADKDGNPVVVRAYPVGEERTAINSAFDNLIEALKADGFLHEREQTEKPAEISYSLDEIIDDGEDYQYSLEGSEEVSSKRTQTFLDAVEDVQKGKKGASERLAKYVDSGMISTEAYQKMIEKYGFIPYGENPSRDIQVPRKTEKDKKVSQTVRTILEAKATPDEAVPTIEKMVEDGIFSYDVYTDKKAISDSEAYLKEYGWTESLNDWLEDVEKGVVSKQHTAMGWALYNNAANTAATTNSESERKTAIQTSLQILDAMVRHQRSAAQALQATRILKKLSPETQLYGVQKSVHAFQKELTDKYGKKAPDLKIDEELAGQFLEAETQEEREAIEKEIYKDIGRQMPSRFVDKWNAWRYLAMLGNLRTHFRNVVGNAGFAPVVGIKNLTATAIESIVYPISRKKMVRGKSLIMGSKADRALLSAAWNDYGTVADMVTNGGKYSDSALSNKYIEDGRTVFKLKPLEWARKGNSKLLEVEDMWFAQPHYAFALAQYCKANNITAEQIARGKAIGPAREYAIKEAQKATYRDTNAFSQMVSGWGRNGDNKNVAKKVFNTVIEGILPFRKTPANILVRGVEYSPLGLLKGLSYDLVQVGRGKMTATEAIDHISAGLTGTGLVALGFWLAAEGLIRGHGEDEEKEKKFKELMGHQGYALELPNGISITLDWLAPQSLPFFVGVNIYEMTRNSYAEMDLSTILRAVTNISEPMLEMSCLQGLNDLFEGIGYASSNDTSALTAIVSSAIASYLMQGLPTLSGQAERTSEEYRMTTYTEKDGFLSGDMQYIGGKASAKIPFWDYNQIPYIDAWGRKEASGTALKRGLNNFLNPAYTSTIEESNMEKELLRLYEKTGETAVFPSRADKYFTVDGKRKDLTADEYVRYATLKGEKSYKLISDLVKSKAYKELDDGEKVKAIEEAYDYANQKAKQAISNYKPDSWVSDADKFGSSVGNYLSFRADVSDTRADNGGKISKEEVVDSIIDMAQNDSEVWKMYLSMYDSTGDHYAHDNGIKGETYMDFLEALDRADKPTESGKYGTYTQDEATAAIKNLKGLSQREKAILWQSVNSQWKAKNNPFR